MNPLHEIFASGQHQRSKSVRRGQIASLFVFRQLDEYLKGGDGPDKIKLRVE
jgi:hypothetical protein